MKFANIDPNSLGVRDNKICGFLNFGDHIQLLAINTLYEYMKIPLSEIKKNSYYELQTYKGEPLILPINLMMYISPLPSGDMFSPDIIPVYLGLGSFLYKLPEIALNALKKWAPIGCRDAVIYDLLQKNRVDSYIAGCITMALPARNCRDPQKIYIIDPPEELIPYIPDEVKKDAVVRSNAVHNFDITVQSPEQYAADLYNDLKENAKLVITNRMHVASPCIAMGIPTILCANKMTATLSWIEKYTKVYLKEDYANIDWNPPGNLVSDADKELILQTAASRAWETYYRYKSADLSSKLTDFYLDRDALPVEPVSDVIPAIVDSMIENGQLKEGTKYALWGAMFLADNFYNEIQSRFPSAELIAIYDKYKTGTYLDRPIVSPELIGSDSDDETLIIVCAFGAAGDAKKMLADNIVDGDRLIIYGDELVKNQKGSKNF